VSEWRFPMPAVPLGYAGGEASIMIIGLQPTPYSLLSYLAAASRRG
jgi:hypothetical protein